MHCYHHNDMDGMCAARIIAEYTKVYDQSSYTACNYSDMYILDDIQPNEVVYFVDYSFTESTKHILDDALSLTSNVYWIDHHDSSIQLCKKYPYLNSIKGIRSKEASGAGLTYMYLYHVPFDEIPKFIQWVSDYDNWNHKFYPVSTWFKYGVDCQNYAVFSSLWDDLFSKIDDNTYNYVNHSVVYTGKIVFDYIGRTYLQDCRSYGYESVFEDFPVYVLNKRGNSFMFDSVIDRYPLVVSWIYDGHNYVYSLYSTSSNINCASIAEKYGGGGHKGAAGFKARTLLV